MTSIKDKPSPSQQDPAEGSREAIERELRRKGLEKEADRNREEAAKSRRAEGQQSK
ncbi:MAG TPA: hypothetical protein VFT69_04740 [Pseudolabrys sp.]|nr:hypothetical protein [Pseudolabrys sp.]